MSFFPSKAACRFCGTHYVYMAGCIVNVLYVEPGYCSEKCARQHLLWLLMAYMDKLSREPQTVEDMAPVSFSLPQLSQVRHIEDLSKPALRTVLIAAGAVERTPKLFQLHRQQLLELVPDDLLRLYGKQLQEAIRQLEQPTIPGPQVRSGPRVPRVRSGPHVPYTVTELVSSIRAYVRRKGYATTFVGVEAEYFDGSLEISQWVARMRAETNAGIDTWREEQGSATGPEDALQGLLRRIRRA